MTVLAVSRSLVWTLWWARCAFFGDNISVEIDEGPVILGLRVRRRRRRHRRQWGLSRVWQARDEAEYQSDMLDRPSMTLDEVIKATAKMAAKSTKRTGRLDRGETFEVEAGRREAVRIRQRADCRTSAARREASKASWAPLRQAAPLASSCCRRDV